MEKYLITTNSWFYAPDGKQYRGAWGSVKIFEDSFLGIKTNRNSSNWYLKVGSNDKHIIIAGCQIHYAIKCNNKPKEDNWEAWDTIKNNDKKLEYQVSQSPNPIYIAE